VTVVERLVAAIDGLHPERRVIVAVDGPDAAGKTTLVAELARRLRRPVQTASIDDWHNPPAIRYRRGRESPDGYYRDSFDYDTLVRELLRPFIDGTANVLAHDGRTESAALIVDGVFLQRPELRDWWHLAVYLHVSEEVSLARAVARDAHLHGSRAELVERYRARYLPGQALYRAEAAPLHNADIVIDNSDPDAPRVLRWSLPLTHEP
jgi:uridine kinase